MTHTDEPKDEGSNSAAGGLLNDELDDALLDGVTGGTLKTRHDTAKNSISNVR